MVPGPVGRQGLGLRNVAFMVLQVKIAKNIIESTGLFSQPGGLKEGRLKVMVNIKWGHEPRTERGSVTRSSFAGRRRAK